MHMKYICTLWIMAALVLGCKEEPKSVITSAAKKSVQIPAFSGDNAYANVEKQLAFGFRIPGTEDHKECGEWIMATMKGYGANVNKQDFKANFLGKTNVPSFNIMAQMNPDKKKRILLGAHWDSRLIAEKDDERQDEPIPGADDGASGVAVMLEIARLLSENPIDMGVDFLFFDAEDQGTKDDTVGDSWAQGAQYWGNNKIPKGYRPEYGILLDMVGSEGAVFGREGYSNQNAKQYQDKIWTLAKRMGYSDFFRDDVTGAVMDDHFWVMKYGGIPMIDIINQKPGDRSSFGDYHHTHDDDIGIISKRTLRVVGQVVAAALYNESIGALK